MPDKTADPRDCQSFNPCVNWITPTHRKAKSPLIFNLIFHHLSSILDPIGRL